MPLSQVAVTLDAGTAREVQRSSSLGEFCFVGVPAGLVRLTMETADRPVVALSNVVMHDNTQTQLRVVMDEPVYVAESPDARAYASSTAAVAATANSEKLLCYERDPWWFFWTEPGRQVERLELEQDEELKPLNVGIALFNTKNLEGALASFSEVTAKMPYLADAYFYRGLVNFQLGRTDAAKADFSTLLAIRPTGRYASEAREALEGISRIPRQH
jgi:tetratricopeptide (TPR) repeat protein